MADTRKNRAEAQRRVVEALSQHSSYLYRASSEQVNQINRIIDELVRQLAVDLLERLDNLTPAEFKAFSQGKYTTDRLKGLRNLINRWVEVLATQLNQVTVESFKALSGHEARYARDLLASVVTGTVSAAPSATLVYASAMAQPVLGEMLEDMLADIPDRTRKLVYNTIRQGVVQGDTNYQIVRTLRGTKALNYKDGVLQTTRNSAERTVRTARNHISNVAYDETYQALGVEYVVDVATLDGRTSTYCASIDGRRHKVGEPHPMPPYHPHCRTVQAPSFDGDIMGRRPYIRAFKPVGQIPKSQRPDDMIGQVSASTTYATWFKRQPASFQKEWLGPSRYKLYRDGNYTIDRFVDPLGKKYTLDELRQKDQETFAELFG